MLPCQTIYAHHQIHVIVCNFDITDEDNYIVHIAYSVELMWLEFV